MAVNYLWPELIKNGIARGAADFHWTTGQRPWWRIDGNLQPAGTATLSSAFMTTALQALLTPAQLHQLERQREVDFAWEHQHRRFRGHVYYQQGNPAIALRLLPAKIPTLAEINAPAVLASLQPPQHGLVLVCGPTGAGKSTTLAAFLDTINHTANAHIVTLEDPIEYIFTPDQCFISQREWGRDFHAFPQALRGCLREMPDIVLVGEIRDHETLATALTAAAAGMLVLGTLHSPSAPEAILRMEGLFPHDQRDSIRALIAQVLTAIIAQNLLPANGGGRTALFEVLLKNPASASLIRQGKYNQLLSVMQSHQELGMQTRSQALQKLWQAGKISQDTWKKQQGDNYDLSL